MEPDSASTPGPVATGLDQASGSAAAPQVISDTEEEKQTGGAEGSVSGVEEDDEEAAERAKIRPALSISDLARRFSKHVAAGRHGFEWMFRDNEWPAIMKFYEELRKHLFQRDAGVAAVVREL